MKRPFFIVVLSTIILGVFVAMIFLKAIKAGRLAQKESSQRALFVEATELVDQYHASNNAYPSSLTLLPFTYPDGGDISMLDAFNYKPFSNGYSLETETFYSKNKLQVHAPASPKDMFDRYYRQWHQECDQPQVRILSSSQAYTNLPGYRAIESLGRPALPYLKQKMEEDSGLDFMLVYAVIAIEGWRKSDFSGKTDGVQGLRDQVLTRMNEEK